MINPYDADNWQEVSSSNIAAVGTRGHYLIVKFNKGVSYRYAYGAGYYGEMIKADSVGKYFSKEVGSVCEAERLPSEEVGWPEEEDT